MRLLFVVPRFPYPLNKGDRLTVFNYIKYFSERHSVFLITFIASKKELEYSPKIEPFCDRVETVLLPRRKSYLNCILGSASSTPLQVSYYSSREMREKVSKLISENKFDLLYAHTVRMAEYLRTANCCAKVLALQISMGLNYRRLGEHSQNVLKKRFFSLEHSRASKYEGIVAEEFDRCLLISPADKAEIERESRLNNVFLNPHGVDFEYFATDEQLPKERNSIIFTGNMGYAPNVDAAVYFCEQIYPRIKEEVPAAKLYIVGTDPAKRVQRLGRDSGVTVTGFVEDIRKYLDKAEVAIDPLRIGAGLQNKILEGMSMSLPMVVTSIANEGIGATHEKEIFIADNEADFATQVVRLLQDDKLRESIGESARRFIVMEFSWEKHLRDLEELFQELCGYR